MIKAIIFDCFGVLTTDSWKRFIENLPKNMDVTTIHKLNHQLDSGDLGQKDFETSVSKITGIDPADIRTAIMGNLSIGINSGETAKNLALLEYIRTLKPKFKIGLLSNIYNDWVRQSFLTTDEQNMFDDMVLSFEVGMTKPDPAIFRLACKRLGTIPKETVLVDDIRSYCEAARGVGMSAVVYSDFDQLKTELNQIISSV